MSAGLGGHRLYPYEVAELAHRHGVTLGEPLAIAIAVCAGESSFYTGAWNFNDSTGDKSYGLWQINMRGSLAIERRKQWGLASNDELYNPDINARIMSVMSSKGSNWSPWGAYSNKSYLRHIVIARTAVETYRRMMPPENPHVCPCGPGPESDMR